MENIDLMKLTKEEIATLSEEDFYNLLYNLSFEDQMKFLDKFNEKEVPNNYNERIISFAKSLLEKYPTEIPSKMIKELIDAELQKKPWESKSLNINFITIYKVIGENPIPTQNALIWFTSLNQAMETEVSGETYIYSARVQISKINTKYDSCRKGECMVLFEDLENIQCEYRRRFTPPFK